MTLAKLNAVSGLSRTIGAGIRNLCTMSSSSRKGMCDIRVDSHCWLLQETTHKGSHMRSPSRPKLQLELCPLRPMRSRQAT